MYFFLRERVIFLFLLFIFAPAFSTVAAFDIESSDFSAFICSSPKQKSVLPSESFATTCGGRGRTPAFSWSGAPYDTGSYVITLTDISREEGSVSPYLLVWDIPENVSQINSSVEWKAMGALLGTTGPYSGPCPVSKAACLRLSVYAIADRSLGLPEGATFEQLHKRLEEIANINGLLDAAVLYTVAVPRQADSIRTGI